MPRGKPRKPIPDHWRDIYDHLINTDKLYLANVARLERLHAVTTEERKKTKAKAKLVDVEVAKIRAEILALDRKIFAMEREKHRMLADASKPRNRAEGLQARRVSMLRESMKRKAEYIAAKKQRRAAWMEMVKSKQVPVVTAPYRDRHNTNLLKEDKIDGNTGTDNQTPPEEGQVLVCQDEATERTAVVQDDQANNA